MKKTIIALSVATLFSAGAMAASTDFQTQSLLEKYETYKTTQTTAKKLRNEVEIAKQKALSAKREAANTPVASYSNSADRLKKEFNDKREIARKFEAENSTILNYDFVKARPLTLALELKNAVDDQGKTNYRHQVAINGNFHDIQENKADIETNRGDIETNRGNIAKNTKRIGKLEGDFQALSNDYYSFKEQTNGAIAGVAAMGQLAQPYGVGKANVGVGVATYNGEQALAIGMGYRYNEQTTFRGAVAANTGDDMEPVVAASVNYEW